MPIFSAACIGALQPQELCEFVRAIERYYYELVVTDFAPLEPEDAIA